MTRAVILWLRRLRRQTALTLFLVLSLGISLAGVVVVLILGDAVLWRELPFYRADRLVKLEPRDAGFAPRWVSIPEFRAIADTPGGPYAAIAGYTFADYTVTSEAGAPPEPLLATMITPQFFDVLRVMPQLGALPEARHYFESSDRIVLISHDFWQRRYGGAVDIVGRTIPLAGPEYLPGSDGQFRIIGVLPRDYWLLYRRGDIVLPLRAPGEMVANVDKAIVENLIARLDDRSELAAAVDARSLLLDRISGLGATKRAASITVDSLQRAHFRRERPQMQAVLVCGVLVLLLSATNLAIAALAQALSRRRETAIRMAVGGAPRRLFVETLQDHGITALVAAAVGVIGGRWLMTMVTSQLPPGLLSRLPGGADALVMNGQVVGVVMIALAAIVWCIALAVHMSGRRMSPWQWLASQVPASAGHATSYLRRAMVAAEIAGAVCVVGVAGVLVLQLRASVAADLGVSAARTQAVWLNLRTSKYPDAETKRHFYDAVARDVRASAGIESVGGIDLPFYFDWQTTQVSEHQRAAVVDSLLRAATPGYLDVSGIRLVEGRWFEGRDDPSAPSAAVISSSLARELQFNGSAIGRALRIGDATKPEIVTVVGVVSDTRHSPAAAPDRILYRPVAQSPPQALYLLVRTHVDTSIERLVGGVVWTHDPDQAIEGPWTMDHWVSNLTASLRFVVLMTGVLALIAALLAVAGVYGVSAHWVAESSRDLGIRRAIGAADRQIVRWFGAQWIGVVLPGMAAGAGLQWMAQRLLLSRIDGLTIPDAAHALIGAFVVVICGIVASLGPLRRALGTDAASLMR